MRRYCIILAILVGLVFATGVRPSFDVYGGWHWSKVTSGSFSSSDNYVDLRLGINVPYSRYVGLTAALYGVTFGGGTTQMKVAGRIGLIEMIPTDIVSPYSKQQIVFDYITAGGSSRTDFGFGVDIGLEFISNFYVSPFIEGGFAFMTSSSDGSSATGIGFGAGGGIRISWVK